MDIRQVERDSYYRVSALDAAIARAGQDGGIEGGIDVLALGEVYYNWLMGEDTLEKPALDEMRKVT